MGFHVGSGEGTRWVITTAISSNGRDDGYQLEDWFPQCILNTELHDRESQKIMKLTTLNPISDHHRQAKSLRPFLQSTAFG